MDDQNPADKTTEKMSAPATSALHQPPQVVTGHSIDASSEASVTSGAPATPRPGLQPSAPSPQLSAKPAQPSPEAHSPVGVVAATIIVMLILAGMAVAVYLTTKH